MQRLDTAAIASSMDQGVRSIARSAKARGTHCVFAKSLTASKRPFLALGNHQATLSNIAKQAG